MKWIWGAVSFVAVVGVSVAILCTKRPATARADGEAPAFSVDSVAPKVAPSLPPAPPTQIRNQSMEAPRLALPAGTAGPSLWPSIRPPKTKLPPSPTRTAVPEKLQLAIPPQTVGHGADAGSAAATADKPPLTPQDNSAAGVELQWVGASSVQVGRATDFGLLLRNRGFDRIHGATVHVQAPAGVRVTATSPTAANDHGTLTWHFETLLPGQVLHLHMGFLAAAHGNLSPRAWVTFTSSVTSVLHMSAYEPKLGLRLSQPARVVLGDTATFALHVTNLGDGPAENVAVHAVLSPGLSHAGGQVESFDLGNLGAGETRDVEVVCMANAPGMQRCDVSALARAGVQTHQQATIQVLAPRLDLQVNGPTVRYVDRHATYSMFITNQGDFPAENVSAGDILPTGFNFLSASEGGHFDPATRTISWFLGQLGSGQRREVQFDVVAAHSGVYEHRMTACSERGGRVEVERRLTTRVEDRVSLLLEVSDSDDPIEIGKQTVYEVVVTNAGSKTESNLKLVCTLPEQLSFRTAQGPTRYHAEGSTVVFEPVGQLAPRGELVYKITTRALAAGEVHFQTRLTSAGQTEAITRSEHTRIYADHQ
jgi:uncharacterized repeat protein (TIGR01451 family)